jgi:hypothetical protein
VIYLLTWEEAKAIFYNEKVEKIFASVAFNWATRLSQATTRYLKKWGKDVNIRRADVRVDGNGRRRLNK